MKEGARLAVIERGELAVRVLNAVHDVGRDDAQPISAVLVLTEPDQMPWYGREADEVLAVAVGDETANVEQIVAALVHAEIDIVWIGHRRAGDRNALVEACAAAGMSIVGPTIDMIRAIRADVAPRPEAGPPRRRIQMDVLADAHGTVWCLGGRDVSIRRAGRPLLAEAPCAAVGPDLGERMCSAAVDLVRGAAYRGAAVVEMSHDGDDFRVDAVDVVAAPDHATHEERTGVSIIGHRVRVADGARLGPTAPVGEGVAVEAHLLAEDPAAGFATVPAEIALIAFPAGAGVRIDANRRPGDRVDASDPLLGIVTAWGPDRATALQRLGRALSRTSVVLSAGSTNRTLLLALLAHPDVIAGEVDDGWLDRHLDELLATPPDPLALVVAAVELYEADRELAQAAFFAAAARGRPEPQRPVGDRIQLAYAGHTYHLTVDRTGPTTYAVCHADDVADVTVERLDVHDRRVTCGGRRHRAVVASTDDGLRVELDGIDHVVAREDGVVVRAEWPALVVSIPVAVGQHVAAGDPIAVLESMKMETTLGAPFAGEVTAVDVTPNSQVERGAAVIRVRRRHAMPARGTGEAVALRGLERRIDPDRKVCERVYQPLGNYILGFDLSGARLKRLLVQQRRLGEIADPADLDLLECEDGFLDVFADIGALYRPRTELESSAPEDLDLLAQENLAENTQEHLTSFVQWLDADRAGLSDNYRRRLLRALDRYGITSLERGPELETALTWLFRSIDRLQALSDLVVAILQRRLAHRRELAPLLGVEARDRLDGLANAMQGRQQAIADLARDVRFHFFDEPALEAASAALLAEMSDHFDALAADPERSDRDERVASLVSCPQPLRPLLLTQWRQADPDAASSGSAVTTVAARRAAVAEVFVRRYYRRHELSSVHHHDVDGYRFASAEYPTGDDDAANAHLVVVFCPLDELTAAAASIAHHLATVAADRRLVVDAVTWHDGPTPPIAEMAATIAEHAAACEFGRAVDRLVATVTHSEGAAEEHLRTQTITLHHGDDGSWAEDELFRNLHPMLADRLEIWRLANFQLERRPSPEDVYLFSGVARENPADRRLFALAEVRELTSVVDPATGEVQYPRLERTGLLALAAMRAELGRHPANERPLANRLVLDISAPWTVTRRDMRSLADRFAPLARRVGLEKVVLKVRIPDDHAADGLRPAVLHVEGVGTSVLVREEQAGDEPIKPLSRYRQKVLTAERFGVPYPYEIVRLMTRRGPRDGRPADSFVELDLAPRADDLPADAPDQLVPVDREPGNNDAHVVVGLFTHHTDVVPEGIRRIALLSDPTQGLGNLAEPECRRINAALAYGLEHRIPVEWFAVSSGALISMDSGTENMDWIALTLRRLIEFTQAGGEVNILVTGINVGGQPYWNAEATMLMHTKGILVMSPSSTMVLTGKQALDYSGAVSAEDNHGIGGYERVMGPNGQAQYFASSFGEACEVLRRHYELTYVVPGERFPRRHATADPIERDVRTSPHARLAGSPFTTVGDIFSAELNPERKQPFDMRSVMRAVADSDTSPLERWRDLRDGDTSIVWDTTVGGIPVCLLGLESHTVPRRGFVPADGPPAWTSGTLFPHSSRKTARAVNAASAMRPLVVLANLSGFDGSPESMRRRQLEFGAEIGRAVTNFDGPIVFVVVSRYHGGAFVVFSKALNESMEIAAVEGSFASVIGGAPAAATVFAREVKTRTQRDDRVREATEAAAAASGPEAAQLRAELASVTASVRSEKLGEVAAEFDAVHTIERARRVGSVDRIIAASELRSYVVDALERGMARFTG